MVSVMCLHFSMQEIFLNILMSSVICVHLGQLIEHYVI